MQNKKYFMVNPVTSLMALILITVAALLAIPVVSSTMFSNQYTEDFIDYTHKAYTDDTVWDIWQGQVRLARRVSVAQYNPAATSDSEENLFVVWTDSRNGNGNADVNVDIFAQKLDGSGNQLWTSDIQVNSDSIVTDQQNPAIASDGGGDLLIVWSDSRNGNWDIYAQKLDENGNKVWTNDIRVNSDGGSASQRFPAIANDNSGNLLIVWQDSRNGSSDIYAQKLNSSGAKEWANDVRVSINAGEAEQILPAVATDNSGSFLIVWQDFRNSNSDIYAQKLNSNGIKAWAEDIRVNSDAGEAEQTLPAVAGDSNGNLLVVWQDSRNDDGDIYAQKLNSNGNKLWADDIRVNSDVGNARQRTPAIASDDSDNLLIAWQDYRNGTNDPDIYAQQLDSNGSKIWDDDIRVNSDSGSANQVSPAVTSDTAGNLLVVWQDYRNNDADIYAQKIDSSGSRLWVSDIRTHKDSGAANQMSPAVVSDSNGNLLVVWEDYRNGNASIYAQKLSSEGAQLWPVDIRVSVGGDTASQILPKVAIDNADNLLVVWADERGGTPNIYVQKLDTNGQQLWAEDRRVSNDNSNLWQLSPSIASDSNGNVLVAWTDSRNGSWDIYAQRLDGNGNRLWTEDIRVNSNIGSTSQTNPDLTSDNNGNLLLVWRDGRNGNYDFYAQKLDEDGNKIWSDDVRVNSDSGLNWQPYPAIASDDSNNLLLTWSDDRSGNNNVYAQKIDEDGNKLWASDIQVNSNSGTSSQSFPAIASDSGGSLLLVWQDYRNGDADLYAQKLDGNGAKAWAGDIRVNSDSGMAWQSTPDITSDNYGNVLLAWRDYRNGNNDIYTQRLHSNGNKLWMEDVQVVYPDVFYLPVGLVESHTVNATGANIVYAELTVMAELNGGDVQYYLTNNGGQDWIAVTPGGTHIFTTTGSDLRWRATLTASDDVRQSPVVDSLSIAYGSIFPPTNLAASAVSPSEINLNWVDNSDNEAGFKIERSLDGGSDWIQIGTVGVNVTSYQDSDLNCDTTYYYRVRAYNVEGDSAYTNIASATTAICTPGENNWLFLTYMACDADAQLDAACQQAMNRLQQAAANPHLNIVALYDKPGANNGVRYHIQPNGNYQDGVNRWHLGEINTAHPDTLANFIVWGRENYPAEHTALVILGHGLGHVGIGWDWTTGQQAYLTPTELRTAIHQGTAFGAAPLDLVFYDACLMGLLEHAYQLDGLALVMVASENLTWLPFPYQQLNNLIGATTTPRELAAGMVTAYAAAYSHRPYTISALDLTHLEPVVAATDALAQVLQANMVTQQTAVQNSRTAAQKFNTHDFNIIDNTDAYLDLYDLAHRLQTFVPESTIQAAAAEVKESIGQAEGDFIIAEAHASGFYTGSDGNQYYWDLSNAQGVAIYFPHTSGGPGFDGYMTHQFQFTIDTHWNNFLTEYYGVLGPPPDPGGDPELPPVLVSDYRLFLPVIVR